MKRRAVIITCAGTVSIAALVWIFGGRAAAQNGNTIYDPNSDHLWNRLNQTLFARTAPDGKKYGLNELDILYWYRTEHLLIGPSHQKALAKLDEFISKHGEKLIHEPLKRALLQRDLWALFDWVAVPTPYGRAQFPKARCFTRFLSFSFPLGGETTHLIESAPKHENEVTVNWKQRQFSWGLLEGLWNQNN